MDWISQLPEGIAHHILSCFNTLEVPPTELVRMSALSKTWYHLTASFPLLDFCMDDFPSRESFFKYLEYTTSRFCHQNLAAQRFKLIATLHDSAELDILNRCLELVLEKGVKKLEIYFTYAKPMPMYFVPSTLPSVFGLNSLSIWRCELPSSLIADAVQFRSLTRLELGYIHIDDDAIKHLITSCRRLQLIRIMSCHGFKRICVDGHQNLQDCRFFFNTSIEGIDIDAPNLSRILIEDIDGRGPPELNLASCEKLKKLKYMGHPSPNSNGFTNYFLSNSPFIEKLLLDTRHVHNSLKLSSQSLRTLVLHTELDLEKIELCIPNLRVFVYCCNSWYLWPSVRHLNPSKACMECYPQGSIDALWFQKLRVFFEKKNGFKASNLYIQTEKKFAVLENLKAIELPPYELNHVELHFDNYKKSIIDHAAFVDALLGFCRPRSLTLRWSYHVANFKQQSDLVKFTYKKLLQQEDQGHTNIRIVSPASSKAPKHFRGALRKTKEINFIKEAARRFESSRTRRERRRSRQSKACGYGPFLMHWI